MKISDQVLYQLGDISNELVIKDDNVHSQFLLSKRFDRNIQQQQNQKQQLLYILDPEQLLKVSWDVLGMFFIFVQMITIPLIITFSLELYGVNQILISIMDYYFMIDIIVQFQTGYYVNGNLITQRKKIALNYLKTWFIIDIVSSFPYNLVIESNVEETQDASQIARNAQILKMLRFFRFIKLIRLVRALKLKKIIDRLEDQLFLDRTITAFLQFIKICVVILCLAHWCACIWNAIISIEDSDTWFKVYKEAKNVDDTWQQQYLAALYFSITTMITIGYGDITPISINEQIFAIFMMILSSGLFGYVMNMIVALFESQDKIISEIANNGESLIQYLKQKKAPNGLKFRIKNYLDWLVEQEQIQRNYEYNTLISLSASLKKEVLQIKYKQIVKQIQCFEVNFSKSNSNQFASLFKEKIYNPEEFIIKQNDMKGDKSCIYFIRNGKVSICYLQRFLQDVVPENCRDKRMIQIQKLQKNQYFGEIGFFANIPRTASAQAQSFVNCYELERSLFLNTFQDSVDLEKWFEIKFNIEFEQNFENLSLKCYLCEEDDHVAKYCSLAHYQIDLFQRMKVINNQKKNISNFTKIQRKQKSKIKSLQLMGKVYESVKDFQLTLELYHSKNFIYVPKKERKKKLIHNFECDESKEFQQFYPDQNLTKIKKYLNLLAEENIQIMKQKKAEELRQKAQLHQNKFIDILSKRKKNKQLSNKFSAIIKLAVNQSKTESQQMLLRKQSSDENKQRLRSVQRRRETIMEQRMSVFHQSKLQISLIQEDQELEENSESEYTDKSNFSKKLLSTGKSHQTSTSKDEVDKFPDIFAETRKKRSNSDKRDNRRKQFNFTKNQLENMIYMVINHKFSNFK